MSAVRHLKDMRDDLRTLLEYAQTLKTENDRLRRALKGSVVFLSDGEGEKVLGALAADGAAFPRLRAVGNSSLAAVTHTRNTASYKSHLLTGTEETSRSLPDAPGFSEARLNGEGGVNGIVEDVVGGAPNEESAPPQLFRVCDLADVLLEHNKLLGRLRQFTASSSTDPTTSTPNIGDHHLTGLGVAGIREHQNNSEFVLRVSWSNGQNFELYRTYLDFFTLQARMGELRTQKERAIPKLPLSDHLLAVLGRLNSTESLHNRTKLVDAFCTALLEDVRGREVSDICRTSVLIFFVPRPGDVHIESTGLDSRFSSERESDVFSEDCLGFLSSVALTQDQQWYNTHSDLLDAEEEPPRKLSGGNDLGLAKPSAAHLVLTHTNSAPETQPMPIPQEHPSPTASRDWVVAKLKNSVSLDHDQVPGQAGAQSRDYFRHRSSNIVGSPEVSRARVKALCIKTGSMDWGVRETATASFVMKTNSENGSQ